MFGVDFSELVVIFAVSLVVLGPKRLPGLVRKIGRWVGKARAMARQFREQLENEINLDELNRMNDTHAKDAPTRASTTPAPPPEFTGAPVTPASEPPPNYGTYPYAPPPADPAPPAAAPKPGDDTYSHAHADGAPPLPHEPPEQKAGTP